jgi:hypothetical protein
MIAAIYARAAMTDRLNRLLLVTREAEEELDLFLRAGRASPLPADLPDFPLGRNDQNRSAQTLREQATTKQWEPRRQLS